MTDLGKMPEEMLVEILLRLLAKSLLRFKCVQKSWYNLIKNPSFVAKNLAKGPTNNSFPCLLLKRLIVKDTDAQNKEAVFSLLNISSGEDNGEHDIHYVIEDMTKGRFVELKMLESAWIVGHCDAIVCLVDPNKAIVLLNPATMEFKLVTAEQHVPDKRINMGFGYDPKSKSFKIVDALPVEQERYCFYQIPGGK